jgi:hypothetical protein
VRVRKVSILAALIAVLLLLLSVAACGNDTQTSDTSSADQSPQSILEAAATAQQNATSAQGTFKVEASFDVDSAQLPEEAKSLLDKPMSLAGTFAFGTDPQLLADATLDLSMAGETLNMGIKSLTDKAWLCFSDQWYEAPAELQDALRDSAGTKIDVTQIKETLAGLGIDPSAWLKDLRLAGEETVDGTKCYHLTGTPDLTKMTTDLTRVSQDQDAMKQLDPKGTSSDLMQGNPLAPDAEKSQEMQQLAQTIQNPTADIWIAKDSMLLAKFTANGRIVPPADEETGGLNAITVTVDASLHDVNKPVTVEAPTAAQPWTALEKAMQENPGAILGPLAGILGMAGAMVPSAN